MSRPRSERICPTCEHNMFCDSAESNLEPECILDNDVYSHETCEDYERRNDDK
jgi:hypothetical protein